MFVRRGADSRNRWFVEEWIVQNRKLQHGRPGERVKNCEIVVDCWDVDDEYSGLVWVSHAWNWID